MRKGSRVRIKNHPLEVKPTYFSKQVRNTSSMIRIAIVFLIHAVFLGNFLVPSLFPYGPASLILKENYPHFTPLDRKNDRLRASS